MKSAWDGPSLRWRAGWLYLVSVTPHERKIAAIVARLLEWFPRNARDLPWRRTHDPYAIWVSEVMLQQTQVSTVLPYWERWMEALPNLAALAKARPQRLHKLWEGLGYYTRVRNLQKAARLIVEDYAGQFPTRFEDVLALPGIGRYTAGAICSICFGQPKPILDGNVIRVLARIFAIDGDPREKATNAVLWDLAERLVLHASNLPAHASRGTHHAPRVTPPPSPCSQLNQSLMELGALICTPRQPNCLACPLTRLCLARRQGLVAELPMKKNRTRPTARQFLAFVWHQGGRFLVRQRPAGVVNAHLWEFPNIELDHADPARAARRILGFTPAELQHLCTIRHTITRYRITLEAFRVSAPREPATRAPQGLWLTPRELARLPFPSAHKRILQKLL